MRSKKHWHCYCACAEGAPKVLGHAVKTKWVAVGANRTELWTSWLGVKDYLYGNSGNEI
jgi:hypothetical protein